MELLRRAPGCTKGALFPPQGSLAAHPLPHRRWKPKLRALLCHPSLPPTSPLYTMFSGGRNLKFNTSLPSFQCLWMGSGQRCAAAGALRGRSRLAGAAGSWLYSNLLLRVPAPPLAACTSLPASALPRNLCHLLSDSRGERHRHQRAEGRRQRGDPQAGAPGGLCLALCSSAGTGLAGKAPGREAEGVWLPENGSRIEVGRRG